MWVYSRRNIVIPGPVGEQPLRLQKDGFGEVPEWAAETPYFQALLADGKIVLSGKKDVKKGRRKPEVSQPEQQVGETSVADVAEDITEAKATE